MNRIGWSRILFGLAALYDAVLGIAFLAAPKWIYATCGVPEPNHWGYIQFPAALLLIFAVMFVAIASDPEGNRGLILYGIGLKVAYCSVAFGHWFGSGIPDMWKPFAIADVVMLALFLWAYAALGALGAAAVGGVTGRLIARRQRCHALVRPAASGRRTRPSA